MIWMNKVRYPEVQLVHFDWLNGIDQEWLDAINTERRKEQLDKISCEVFEIVMDRLEKEWFDLVGSNLLPECDEIDLHSKTKHIPKPDLALPSEDSTCAICDDSEGENSNAIVFCDGCNLAVHQGTRAYLPSALHLPVLRLYRLLWRSVYSRRSMAMSQVYSIPWKPSGKLGSHFRATIHPTDYFRSNAYCVPMKVALSSKQCTVTGFICFALFGYQKRGLWTRYSWNLLMASRRYQNSGGS